MTSLDATADYENVYYTSQLTETNRSGWLLACGIMSMSYCLSFLAMRAWVKYRRITTDDWMCAGSTLLGIVQYALLFVATSAGLGRAESALIELHDPSDAAKMYQATQILFILAHGGAKLTIATLVHRLFAKQMKASRRASQVLMGLCMTWIVSSLLVLFIGCPASITSREPGTCPGEYARWAVVSAMDMLIEVLALALVIILTRHIQLKRSQMTAVILSFLPRLGLILPAVFHAEIVRTTAGSGDVAFAHVRQAVWLQIMLAWSLLTCSIPSFRTAMRPFETGPGKHSSSTERPDYDEAAGNILLGPAVKPSTTRDGRSSHKGKSQRSHGVALHSDSNVRQISKGSQIQVDFAITVEREYEERAKSTL